MRSNAGYEARAIGWRDPDDHEAVRYQPTILFDGEEVRRYWIRSAGGRKIRRDRRIDRTYGSAAEEVEA